jgi:hypothetical protein
VIEEKEHINPALRKLLDASQVHQEFAVPKDYFEHNEGFILSLLTKEEGAVENDFFAIQQEQILSVLNLENALSKQEEFKVPADYFSQLEYEVLAKTVDTETKVVAIGTGSKRAMWYAVAAAACVAFAVLFFWPKTNAVQTEKSFAELLEQTELSEDEVDEIVTDEVYYEMVMDNIYLLADTAITDSNTTIKKALPDAAAPTNILDKNKKNAPSIKPKAPAKTLNWDSITEEEMMEFLENEADDDLLDEL